MIWDIGAFREKSLFHAGRKANWNCPFCKRNCNEENFMDTHSYVENWKVGDTHSPIICREARRSNRDLG